MFDRHQTEKTADRTFRIFEEKFVNAYLLMGDEKALWIDTGNGSGNLSVVVQSLTHLPVYARSATPFASRIAAKMFGVKHRPVKQPHKPVFVPVSLPCRPYSGSHPSSQPYRRIDWTFGPGKQDAFLR